MTRIDFSGAILALLTGFIVSAGLVGIVFSTGAYQLPMMSTARPMVAGPAGSVVQAPAPLQAAAGARAAVDAKIVATDLKFTPATIDAKVGQPIKITFDNKGVIEHDLTFPTIKADKPAASLTTLAKPGQTTTLEFTPTAAGKYEYICTIPGHKESGMKGTINVAQ